MTDLTELARRLDDLEDKGAITDLISSYAHGFDRRDSGILRSIWADDAVLDMGANWGDPYRGIDAIMTAADGMWANTPSMYHWMANILIDVDGDTATAVSTLDCLATYLDAGPAHVGGFYRDVFTRTAEGWKIQHRVFDMTFFTPLPEWVPTGGSQA